MEFELVKLGQMTFETASLVLWARSRVPRRHAAAGAPPPGLSVRVPLSLPLCF
jgi:hypothetical protein